MRTLPLLCLLVILSACGGASAAAKPLAAGQPARVGDLVITYTGAHLIPDNASVRAEVGKQWLLVAVTVQNRGRSGVQIVPLVMFAVVDRQGGRWLQAFVSPAVSEDRPIDGVLPAGESVSGTITIEAPIAAAPYRLRYTRPGTTQTATWAITLP